MTQEKEVEQKVEQKEALAPAPPRTQEEIDALIATAVEKAHKEEFDRVNRLLSQQGADLKRLRDAEGRQPSTETQTMKALINEMERLKDESGDPESKGRLQALKAQIVYEEQKQGRESYTKTWRDRLEQKIKDANLSPTDEQFDEVWDAFDLTYAVDGKFERADKKLDKVIKAIKPVSKEEKPVAKTEKTYTQAELAEEKRKWMEEKGLLKTEPGQPSGASASRKQIIADYSKNPRDPVAKKAYMDLRREEGR